MDIELPGRNTEGNVQRTIMDGVKEDMQVVGVTEGDKGSSWTTIVKKEKEGRGTVKESFFPLRVSHNKSRANSLNIKESSCNASFVFLLQHRKHWTILYKKEKEIFPFFYSQLN